MASGFLRVYFLDDAWVTIPAKYDTPTEDIRQTVLKKRNLLSSSDADGYRLFMVDSTSNSEGYEKCLEPSEFPLEIQETLRKHGQLDSFKFVIKVAKQEDKTGGLSGNSSDSADDIFSTDNKMTSGTTAKEGYLEKRGKRNKAWRERWFVLQNGSLHYFKTHTRANAISSIPLADAAFRECEEASNNTKGREYLFEIVTSGRIFQLKAASYDDMISWMNALKQFSPCQEEQLLDDIGLWIEAIEYAKATKQESMVEACTTLEGCLGSVTARQYYMDFVTANHMEENLMFWITVDEYGRANGSSDEIDEMKTLGMDIVNKFIKSGSSHEIGYIDGASREKIPKIIQNGSDEERKAVFADLKNKSFSHMELQGWPQFKNSQHFKVGILQMTHEAGKGAADNIEFEDYDHKGAQTALSPSTPVSLSSSSLGHTKKKIIGSSDNYFESVSQPATPSSTPKLASNSGGATWKQKTIFDFGAEEEEEGGGVHLFGSVDKSDGNNSKTGPSPVTAATDTAAGAVKAATSGGMFDISDNDDDIDDLLAEFS